jgi:soluble lytic murein transglycosylase-like protein
LKKIIKLFLKLKNSLRNLIAEIKFKYFLPYFLLLSVLISAAFLSYFYVLPMYYGYIKERQDVKFLKQKIRIDYEKIRVFKIIKSFNSGLPVSEEKKVSNLIFNLGEKYKINPALILAVIRVESSFNNFSYSDVGAVGLMQIKPITGLYLIKKYGIKSKKYNYNTKYIEYLPVNYLYNPSLNIKIGARYLLSLLYEFKNLKLALFAYNVGPTLAYRTLSFTKTENGKVKFKLNANESTNRLFSDFYYGYYKRVKKYFAIYNKDIFESKKINIKN